MNEETKTRLGKWLGNVILGLGVAFVSNDFGVHWALGLMTLFILNNCDIIEEKLRSTRGKNE